MAVPGEIKGYVAAKERYGNPDISWQRLVQPSVEMCRNGVEVSESLAGSLQEHSLSILNDPGLRWCIENLLMSTTWHFSHVRTSAFQ